MEFEKTHSMLLQKDTFEAAREQVLNYFEKTILINYDFVEIIREKSYQGTDPEFWTELESGVSANLEAVHEFASKLKENDCHSLEDILNLRDRYSCKLLHIITHFMDGFIGVDSVFYSLIEDSHWLSEHLRNSIIQNPEQFFLVSVHAGFHDFDTASFIHV